MILPWNSQIFCPTKQKSGRYLQNVICALVSGRERKGATTCPVVPLADSQCILQYNKCDVRAPTYVDYLKYKPVMLYIIVNVFKIQFSCNLRLAIFLLVSK